MEHEDNTSGTSPLSLDAKEILSILPHRYPFLLVDRILELEPGKRVVARKNVTFNEPFFVGHFPGNPIMPGVIIIEAMAQAGGVMILSVEKHRGKLAYLAAVEKARFRKTVLPGDSLTTTITMQRAGSRMGWVKAVAHVDGVLVCEADLAFALVVPDTSNADQSE